MAGLRRNEIDKLEWSAFDWAKGMISIQTTKYFTPKSEGSGGNVEIDPEVIELFRGFKARATGSFVVESNIAARPEVVIPLVPRPVAPRKESLLCFAVLQRSGALSETPTRAGRRSPAPAAALGSCAVGRVRFIRVSALSIGTAKWQLH